MIKQNILARIGEISEKVDMFIECDYIQLWYRCYKENTV